MPEASEPATPPRISQREAGEVARRIAATLVADPACEGGDPDALFGVAARIAADYAATMRTVAPSGQYPVILRVRVGEAGGQMFVDLEP
ncbi:MAG: hypothetical protein FJ125_17080 [Deltaproteobacteria bacterium]|nr:hypothetical protein [Deltaproteobacteria bacterium]